jgi:hypothetical protein
VTDNIAPQPPLDGEESSARADGTAPGGRRDDARSLGDVDQDLPDLTDDQVSSGEGRYLTAEEILNQPEVPIEVPGVGTSIRLFIGTTSRPTFQGARLASRIGSSPFKLARLTTSPAHAGSGGRVAGQRIVAAIRLLVASPGYRPPAGERSIESFCGRVAARLPRTSGAGTSWLA